MELMATGLVFTPEMARILLVQSTRAFGRRSLSCVSLGFMFVAVVLLVLIAISAPVVCRGEHAEPTGD